MVVSSPKQRALLLYLLVNRGRVYSADRILDAVWEEDTPTIKAAAAAIRVAIPTIQMG